MSEIKYWTPVHNAWDRMVQVLFRPFDMGKWMVIGFAAFLANCGREQGGGNNNFNYRSNSGGGGRSDSCGEDWSDTFSEIAYWCSDVWAEYSRWIILGGCLIILLIVGLTILVNWLNSRGQFMFLDNLVKNRAAVKEPWHEYRREGNSLMWLQVLLGLLVLVSVLALIGGMIMSLVPMISAEQFSGSHLAGMLFLVFLLIIVCIVSGFFNMVLSHFVVPLMYQRRISVREGFNAFAPILRTNFWRIVLFGLVMALVNGAIGVALVLGILLTCCTALVILIIPYIGTVALLPVYVFIRFIGPEFLRQFGDDYDLLTEFPLPQKTEAAEA